MPTYYIPEGTLGDTEYDEKTGEIFEKPEPIITGLTISKSIPADDLVIEELANAKDKKSSIFKFI